MSKKDYKQGMADAMESYVPFGEKQEAAIRHVGDQVKQTADKVDKLGGKIGDLVDYISDREKAALYKLNTPVDIADMEDAEKRVLLAVLYQLSTNEEPTTSEQQNYVRAVQQYLKIYNPQTMIDLGAVENIDSSAAAQAILQTVLEFFYLGTDLEETLEKYDDFLCCFPVSRITEKRVHRNIKAIIEVVGIQGLTEKYGIVAEQPRSEFATYNDNGPIPEKVADLCLTYIKNGCDQFQNGEYVLETKDYLVLCKKPAWTSWETLEKDKKLADNGFFCIEKRSGKVTRIAVDYKKDFPFTSVENLSFCVQENTVYFIENCVDREKYPEVHLVSIDFAKKEFQVQPFKFSISTYNVPVRFHISCNKAYVMIYAYLLVDFSCTYNKDATRPLSKIFVVDLVQGNRVFTIEPDLIVRDAFIYENQLVVLGATKEGTRTGFRHHSLFKYDVKTKITEDLFPEYEHTLMGMMIPAQLNVGAVANWIDEYNANCIVENILQTENKWYLLCRIEDKHSRYSMNIIVHRLLSFPRSFGDNQKYAGLKDIFKLTREYAWQENAPIFLDNRYAISWEKHNDNLRLMHYNLLSDETTYPDEGSNGYVLLGDYLYKRVNNDWYKTNISQGWDALQWEYVTV